MAKIIFKIVFLIACCIFISKAKKHKEKNDEIMKTNFKTRNLNNKF